MATSIVRSDTDTGDPPPRCWTREEYRRAGELEIFGPEERLELIEGEILQKMASQGTPHVTSTRLTVGVLEQAFGDGFEIRTQMPIGIGELSEPEPDVAVVPGGPRDYEDHHPTPEEILLLVEVSDKTLRFDRGRKARLYARAGIQEYWIVNLIERRLETHRDPTAEGVYRSVMSYAETDSVTPLAAPGASVRVADLLPRPIRVET